METIVIEPESRFRLERLCDAYHPEEVGGYLFGYSVEDQTFIKDIFPVPNVIKKSKRRNTYRKHDWGDHWSRHYEHSTGLTRLGDFHSHPNGSIPSTQDMRACPGLHLWLIHHAKGEHTFVSARDYHNLEVVLTNEPHEISSKPRMIGGRLELGVAVVNELGNLNFDGTSRKILDLNEKQRQYLLVALKSVKPRSYPRGHLDVDAIANKMGVTRKTAQTHLSTLVRKGLLDKPWRGQYRVPKEWYE